MSEATIGEKISAHRVAMVRDEEKYNVLCGQDVLTLRQQKEKASLRKSAFERFFHSGSIGPRHKQPLY